MSLYSKPKLGCDTAPQPDITTAPHTSITPHTQLVFDTDDMMDSNAVLFYGNDCDGENPQDFLNKVECGFSGKILSEKQGPCSEVVDQNGQ
jgi:hypothetical protein